MTRFDGIMVVTLMLSALMYSCDNKRTSVDNRCPMLIEKAEYYNAQVASGTKEGPMGMNVRVEYVDSVYRIIQIVDENLIPVEKLKLFYENQKPNMIAMISSASGQERRECQQMVAYRVTFEHIVKSKNTGKVIVRTTMTPDEIADALSHRTSRLDELRTYVATQKATLPRVIEIGYIMNDISCLDGVVNIDIIVDESVIKFDESMKFKTMSRPDLAVTLGDLTVGLTFWGVAAMVPAGIDFHFIGSNGNRDMHITFSKSEVVKYNDVMNRIKEQKFK